MKVAAAELLPLTCRASVSRSASTLCRFARSSAMMASVTERARAVSPVDPALTSETRRSLRAISAPRSSSMPRGRVRGHESVYRLLTEPPSGRSAHDEQPGAVS